MSFAAVLRTLVAESGGAIAAVLLGRDGIPIEQVDAGRLAPDEAERIASAGAELGRIFEEIRKASDSFGGGQALETVVRVDRFWLLLRPVDDETHLLLVLEPDGNVGKARFLMRRHLAALQAQL
jgi:predicted regulator of Ras-like GTPase activity (Roadblock/LC7/MglB family)